MTLSTRFDLKAFLPEQTFFGASFAPNGTSQPTDVSKGIKVSRTGVGAYTVTLDVQAAAVVSLQAEATGSTAGLFRPVLGGVTRTNGIISWTVTLFDAAGAAAEVPAATANRVYFTLLISSMSNAVK